MCFKPNFGRRGGLLQSSAMNPSLTLTLLLAVGLLAHVVLKLWLNARQVRHVAHHRAAVPQAYAQTIALALGATGATFQMC